PGNVLNLVDSGDTVGRSGVLEATRIAGLGMGAGIGFTNFTSVNLALGAGADTVSVLGVATTTTINTGTGAGDAITVGQTTGSDGLTQINAPLTIQGKTADQLSVASNISSALTLNRQSAGVGVVIGVGTEQDPGQIVYTGVGMLNVNQSDVGAGSTLTINNTVTTTNALTGGGGHLITVNNAANPTTLTLGANDNVTVFNVTGAAGSGGSVSVIGNVSNKLTVDLSATTNSLNAQIIDGATPGSSAILRGFARSGGDINVK